MRYDKRTAGILLVVLLVACLANLLSIVQPNILDTDPSTYVIVPLIMLPVLAVFTLKNRFDISVKRNDMAVGVALFLAWLAITIYLRSTLSFAFLSYGVEMLAFPLVIAALASLLFGVRSVRRFGPLLAYSLLCSPILLMPVINQNQNFAVANTFMVYNMARAFVHGLSYDGAITMSANGLNISIGQACVGVGALIGLIMFLIPLAYFYNGRMGRKVCWVTAGAALFLALNLFRMFFIAWGWLAYGPNTALLTIHLFVGILIFYISLIVMVLLSGRFGLSLPRLKNEKQRATVKNASGAAISITMAALCFALSVNYLGALYISPLYFSNYAPANFTNAYMESAVGSLVSVSGASSSALVASNGSSAALIFSNASISQQSPLVMLFTNENITGREAFPASQRFLSSYTFVNNDSTDAGVYSIMANGSTLYVYHETLPYIGKSGRFYSLGAYVFIPQYLLRTGGCGGLYDAVYTTAANLLNPYYYNSSARAGAYSAYCFGRRVLS